MSRNLQERVLAAVGKGIEAAALYARLPTEQPCILDCALAALTRAGRLERSGSLYRQALAPRVKRTLVPRHVPSQMPRLDRSLLRTEHEIRVDLCMQLEAMITRWQRQLAADRLSDRLHHTRS